MPVRVCRQALPIHGTAPLPAGLIAATCPDRDGHAVLDRADGLRPRVAGALARAVRVFSRSAGAGCVRLEPLPHAGDRTNRPMRPDAGMTGLHRAQSLGERLGIAILPPPTR